MNEITIIEPTSKHIATIIFLHGYTSNGLYSKECFKTIIQPNIKYIFPTAPLEAVEVPFLHYKVGDKVNAWVKHIDWSFQSKNRFIESGITESSNFVLDLVDKEIQNGISKENIIIGGYSQGGFLANYIALSSPHKFGGVILLATFHMKSAFPVDQLEILPKTSKDADISKMPFLILHGDKDNIVKIDSGNHLHETILAMGYTDVLFKVHEGRDHFLAGDSAVIHDFQTFINRCIFNDKAQ